MAQVLTAYAVEAYLLFLVKGKLDFLFLLLGFPGSGSFLLLFVPFAFAFAFTSTLLHFVFIFLSNDPCLFPLFRTSYLGHFLLGGGCVFAIVCLRPFRALCTTLILVDFLCRIFAVLILRVAVLD